MVAEAFTVDRIQKTSIPLGVRSVLAVCPFSAADT